MVRETRSALLLVISVTSLLSGCEKAKPTTTRLPAPTPWPTPEVVVAAPTKPSPRLTAEGVVYLTKRISVTTDTSVIGIPEGTRVDIVDRKDGRIAGQIEGMVLELTEDEVTNDVDRIEAMLKKRAETEAALAKKVDPLEAAGIHLPEAKPPTVEERRAARLEKLKKIQTLETSIEDAKKQLSELNSLKIETIRKSLGKAKSRDKKTGKEKTEVIDPALDASMDDLRESIDKAQKEIAELRVSLGI